MIRHGPIHLQIAAPLRSEIPLASDGAKLGGVASTGAENAQRMISGFIRLASPLDLSA